MLDFLSQVTVEAVIVPVKSPVSRTPKVLQPTDGVADIRIWENGAIYPSNALIAEFNLEYTAKDAEESGNGLDFIDSSLMPSIKTPQRFLALAITPRKSGKIDVFRGTTYKEDGTPAASVATQGTAMFGKETLLPLIKEVYNVVSNEEGFIDLIIYRNNGITSPANFFHFPKTVTRGEAKGTTSYVRRNDAILFPYCPIAGSTIVEPEAQEETVAENVIEVPAIEMPTQIAETPVTPNEATPVKTGEEVAQELQAKYAEPEYDTLQVGKETIEVEKETNPLFLKLQADRAAAAAAKQPTSAPFEDEAVEEVAEEVVVDDALQIQEDIENGEYDSEEEEEQTDFDPFETPVEEPIVEEVIDEIPVNPFADVPFTRPEAVAK